MSRYPVLDRLGWLVVSALGLCVSAVACVDNDIPTIDHSGGGGVANAGTGGGSGGIVGSAGAAGSGSGGVAGGSSGAAGASTGGAAGQAGTAGSGTGGESWEEFARPWLATFCTECHYAGTDRNYTLIEDVRRDAELIRCGVAAVKLADCGSSPAARQFPISNASSSNLRPTDTQRDEFVEWVDGDLLK